MSPHAYEGSEPYAFISYAHKDSEQVLRILQRMHDEGYRIWYDDGIAPGSEWPENIAQHLYHCAIAVAFVSNNSIASANCRREVTFALTKHKPFLGVLLEPTEMSLGMEMQLSSQQCIFRYNYSSDEDFLQKLLSCPDLIPCRNIVVAPTAEPETPPASAKRPVSLPAAAKAPKATKKATSSGAAPRKKKGPLPAILGAAAAVLVLVLALLLGSGKATLSDGTRVDTRSDTLSLHGIPFDANAAEVAGSMKKLSSLMLSDCTISPGALDFLAGSDVKYLHLADCSGISDFSFLSQLPQLRILTLTNCQLTDGTDLRSSGQLTQVDISGNPAFTDLTQLPLAQLQLLCFANTGVSDVSALADAAALVTVDGSNCPITSIDALASLESLERIYFNDCQISAITQPFMSLSVREIKLQNNGLPNLDCFGNFTVLTSADLSGNPLTSVDWLSKSSATLTTLDLQDTSLDAGDLDILPSMAKLRHLYLREMETLQTLDNIAPLSELETLSIENTGLTSLQGIDTLAKLTKLDLSGNAIRDLSPLGKMTFPKNMVLDLADNRIEDIIPLPRTTYRLLALHDNPVSFTNGSLAGLEGHYLTLDYHDSLHTCSQAKGGFAWPFVLDCPADQQLALKDVIGYGIAYATDDTLSAMLAEEGYSYP